MAEFSRYRKVPTRVLVPASTCDAPLYGLTKMMQALISLFFARQRAIAESSAAANGIGMLVARL